jgi:hypothetical protein
MKLQKIAIYFDEQEIMELEAIALDEDADAALRFLKKLKKKIEVQQRSQCGSKIVRGE